MPARFRVDRTFGIRGRNVFVLCGHVLEGVVAPGQHIRRPPGLDAPLESVEAVRLSATAGEGCLGLTFRYSDGAQLASWHAIGFEGSIRELEGADAEQCPFKVGDTVVYAPTNAGRALHRPSFGTSDRVNRTVSPR